LRWARGVQLRGYEKYIQHFVNPDGERDHIYLHKRLKFKLILKKEDVRMCVTLKLLNDIPEGILGSCHGLFYGMIFTLSWEEQVKLLTLKSRYLPDYEPHVLPLRQLDQSSSIFNF
jgi:hypothetical protein